MTTKTRRAFNAARRRAGGLTDAEMLFCAEYVRCQNAGEAMAIAYPYTKKWSAKSRREKACRLLMQPDIEAGVAAAAMKAAAAANKVAGEIIMDVARTLRETAAVAFSDITTLLGPDGDLLPIEKWPAAMRGAVSSIKVTPVTEPTPGGGRTFVGYRKELRLWDKNAALERLMKYHGLYEADNRQRNPLAGKSDAELRALAEQYERAAGIGRGAPGAGSPGGPEQPGSVH